MSESDYENNEGLQESYISLCGSTRFGGGMGLNPYEVDAAFLVKQRNLSYQESQQPSYSSKRTFDDYSDPNQKKLNDYL